MLFGGPVWHNSTVAGDYFGAKGGDIEIII
jgi:hypothetical protein